MQMRFDSAAVLFPIVVNAQADALTLSGEHLASGQDG